MASWPASTPSAPSRSPAPSPLASCAAGRSGGLEHAGFKAMAFQQPVELGAVAPGQARRLGDVAPGDLEGAHQVVALEGATAPSSTGCWNRSEEHTSELQ